MIIPDTKKKGPDFAQPIPPSNPWVGCVWLNTDTNEIKVWNGWDWDTVQVGDVPWVGNYGYACGGYDGSNPLSTIDRFQFPFDSGTASHVGNLSEGRYSLAANNSSQHGYVCGGDDSGSYFSTIDRFQFPFDSGTASYVGNLSQTRRSEAGCNSSSHGFACGGYVDSTGDKYSTIDRIVFPFDAGTATHVGNLPRATHALCANNSSLHGYACNGYESGGAGNISFIARFSFPFDSGVANYVGYASRSKIACSANNSSVFGYICGGGLWGTSSISDFYSIIDRFQFPFDSGTASHVGNLSGSRYSLVANNSSQYSYVCGGRRYDVGYFSIIDRFQFPFDSGTASHVGNLGGNKNELAATDTTDFIQMFV